MPLTKYGRVALAHDYRAGSAQAGHLRRVCRSDVATKGLGSVAGWHAGCIFEVLHQDRDSYEDAPVVHPLRRRRRPPRHARCLVLCQPQRPCGVEEAHGIDGVVKQFDACQTGGHTLQRSDPPSLDFCYQLREREVHWVCLEGCCHLRSEFGWEITRDVEVG